MSSVRLVSTLIGLTGLTLAACSRPSEPPPGPGLSKPTAASSAPAAESAPAPATSDRRSIHDFDLPSAPPPRPPSDNAKLIRASHILIAYQGALDAPPTVTRDKETAHSLANNVAIEAKAGGDFAELAAKYSDDPKTKRDAGRLGQISRTQLSKPFTDVAFNLIVKEVTSEPVETPYGFHIIKRTE